MTEINNIIQVNTIVNEAKQAAREAAERFFQEKLGGKDQYSCGFAWVDIYGIKGNTRLGKAFKAAGIRKSYTGSYQIWNPAGLGVQNIDTLEAGAEAAAKVFEKYGFRAYAGSRGLGCNGTRRSLGSLDTPEQDAVYFYWL
jgi:hypothetical protein